MLENPKIIIEISGHTDSKGNDVINQKLSEARANSVVNYLVKNGVPSTQLRAKGILKNAKATSKRVWELAKAKD